MQAIRIVRAGPLATIQDWGRYGFQDRGVPVSGAMDREALGIGNSLVGNAVGEAAVEVTLGGFSAEFLCPVQFAVTGADLSARLNGSPLSRWVPHPAHHGDVLTLDQRQSGCRAYLTVAGGIEVPMVMGSKSTYLRGGFGGCQGRRLQSGDVLKCGEPQGPTLSGWPADSIPRYRADPVLRVVPGPQDQAVTAQGWNRFLTGEYRLTMRSDRMGCVLEGPVITHRHGADIISDGTACGAVQVPGNGQPIVLLADRQTIGGYAKIGTVLSCDLPLLAQLVPGDLVRFATVDLWHAREIHLRRAYQLRQALHRLKSRSPAD